MSRAAFTRAMQSMPSFKSVMDAYVQAFLEQVISETMAPSFRDQRFGEGLMRGVEAIGQRLRAERPELRPGEPTKIPPIVDLDQGS